jgi:hypothetical protein
MAINTKPPELRQARTCYDHLAGQFGVAITEAMTDDGLLDRPDDGFVLTPAGLTWLTSLGVHVAELRASRRAITRSCLDWTERRPHLAGAAGAAICLTFFDRGWIGRRDAGRSVVVTPAGQAALLSNFKNLNLNWL